MAFARPPVDADQLRGLIRAVNGVNHAPEDEDCDDRLPDDRLRRKAGGKDKVGNKVTTSGRAPKTIKPAEM